MLYSFRPETDTDAVQFWRMMLSAGLKPLMRWRVWDAPGAGGVPVPPETAIELEVDASLDQLRGIARQVVDGHVMLQTLRPVALAQNSLERDWAAE